MNRISLSPKRLPDSALGGLDRATTYSGTHRPGRLDPRPGWVPPVRDQRCQRPGYPQPLPGRWRQLCRDSARVWRRRLGAQGRPGAWPHRGTSVLATKCHLRGRQSAARLFEHSLSHLQTDHVDILFMHHVQSLPELDQILAPDMCGVLPRRPVTAAGFASSACPITVTPRWSSRRRCCRCS